MTATTTFRRPNTVRASGALIVVGALAFLSGVAATMSVEGLTNGAAINAAAAGAVPTFDAVRFRADERAASYPEPTFDAVKFRAEEAGR